MKIGQFKWGFVIGLAVCVVAPLFLFSELSWAAEPAGLGKVANNITGSFEYIGKLLIGIAYLAGIGFGIASIFKFKQHKDNPTQIPVGTPIALLVIAIALMFLPLLFKPAGETLFGNDAKSFDNVDGLAGGGVALLPGSSGS